jgi:hypothetical protein
MSDQNGVETLDPAATVDISKKITEVILLGKRKDRLLAANAAMNYARQNFENLLNGIVLGMNHDPDDEDCVIVQTEGGGLKLVFGPKGTLGTDGKPLAPVE